MSRILFCFFMLFSLCPITVDASYGQATVEMHRSEIGQPFLRNYSSKEYGADLQNWAIEQDDRGIMYFGNTLGVLEYDGRVLAAHPTAQQVRRALIGQGYTRSNLCRRRW